MHIHPMDEIVKVGTEGKTGDLFVRVHAASEDDSLEAEKRFPGGFACD